jgi:hypothetical protein
MACTVRRPRRRGSREAGEDPLDGQRVARRSGSGTGSAPALVVAGYFVVVVLVVPVQLAVPPVPPVPPEAQVAVPPEPPAPAAPPAGPVPAPYTAQPMAMAELTAVVSPSSSAAAVRCTEPSGRRTCAPQ